MILGGKKFRIGNPKCEHLHVGEDESLLLKNEAVGCSHYILEFMKHRTGRTVTKCQFAEMDRDGVITCSKPQY
jgi:hypothetical protein